MQFHLIQYSYWVINLNLKECFEKGYLREIPMSSEKAQSNLSSALEFLKDAEANFRDNRFKSSLILTYLACLNASKALLFKNGISEGSHVCIVLYLRENYPALKNLVDKYNSLRSRRHSIQYSGTSIDSVEVKDYLNFSQEFLNKVKEVL